MYNRVTNSSDMGDFSKQGLDGLPVECLKKWPVRLREREWPVRLLNISSAYGLMWCMQAHSPPLQREG